MVGALVALRRFAEGEWPEDISAKTLLADELVALGQRSDRVVANRTEHEIPRVRLKFEDPQAARSFVEMLISGKPAIAVDTADVDAGRLAIDTMG